MQTPLKTALATLLLTAALFAQQETGLWRATSQTAKSITGDIGLSKDKLTINFLAFTMVRVRDLEKAEAPAAFDTETNPNGAGSLYRLRVPAATRLLHKNTLCGTEDTEWMALYATQHSLQIAFFSGQKPPVFTQDAISNSSDLCGTYTYSR